MEVPAQRGYQLQFAVQDLDDEGNSCFRVEGPAKLLAVDAGELTSNEPYQNDAIHLFHGQASVMIALTGECGRICVYAGADGMRAGCQVILAV